MARHLIQLLANSKIYQDYERAFSEATGLPLSLRSVESWRLPHHGKRLENPFCALLSRTNRSCAACLQVQQQLAEAAATTPQTVTCRAGLCETAVPVRLGDQLVGFLTTGQVFHKKPTPARFRRTARLLAEWGVPATARELRDLYFGTRVLSAPQQSAVVNLLAIFSQHLSLVSNQIMMHEQSQEPPVITRAKQFINDHHTEKLTLGAVAKAVNTSRFDFSKKFSKLTGIRFTAYLARVRIERSKNLLLNPNLRVSEIAYDTGFQSLTHFNRMFKRIQGRSPTAYRAHLGRSWQDGARKVECDNPGSCIRPQAFGCKNTS